MLTLRTIGRDYLCTELMFHFQPKLIADAVLAERLVAGMTRNRHVSVFQVRLPRLGNDLTTCGPDASRELQPADHSGVAT